MLTIDISKDKSAENNQYEALILSVNEVALKALSLTDIKSGLEQLGYVIEKGESEINLLVSLLSADGTHLMPLASVALAKFAHIPA